MPGISVYYDDIALPHFRGVHRNLRTTNPVDPSSPLKKLTHTITLTVYCILSCLFPPQCGLYSFRVQNKAERLSPVGPGLSRGVTERPVSFTRVYTPRNRRDRSAYHTQLAKQSWVLIKNAFWSISQRKKCIFFFFEIPAFSSFFFFFVCSLISF